MIASRRDLLSSALALLATGGVKLRAQASGAVDLDRLLSLFDFEAEAQARVSHGAWARISGGAADELTLRWNHEAYEHIRLKPRILVDVSKLDTRVTLFGQEFPFPILLAPTGGQRLIHPEGE
jgi:4-hydroxymandelate oxidase